MLKRFFLFALSLFLVWPTAVFSQDTIRVGLFSFDISSEKDLSYLQTEIPKLIQTRLAASDVSVESLELPADPAVEFLRKRALEEDCTHIVWGQLVREGDQFHISAFLTKTSASEPPRELSVTVENIENLLGGVQKLSDNLLSALVPRVIIADMRVDGNSRIEDEAITRIISTKAGDEYVPQALSDDLKSVYNMGYFDDIRIEAADSTEGKVITFHVVEKPTVKSVEFKGNSAIRTEKLEENIDIKSGSILNIFNIRKNIQKLQLQYQEKNYQSVKITYETKEVGNNQVTLVFVIDEGDKIRIKRIEIVGNTAYKSKQIKKLMKTSEKGFFSWLTSSGDYKEELIQRDLAVIDAFYQNNGYLQVRVADPVVKTEGNWIYLTFKLEEGPRYKMGKVGLSGDLVLSEKELLKSLKTPEEEYYNRDAVREDMLALTDAYGDYGYAFADAEPRLRQDAEAKIVDITYTISKGEKVYLEKINISGNTKTKDEVIRRELKVNENALYNGSDLKRSVKNLNRLDFFEDVKVDTPKGEADNTMILNLDVKEKSTGQFTFGGGYSSYEHLFLTSSISQNNFLGGGQSLSLSAQVGSMTTQFMLKYIEPWMFDIPLTTGFTAYNWTRDYDLYDKESMGGSISSSYPFFNEDLRLFTSYSYDIGELTDIADDASIAIKSLEGRNITSSITLGTTYDTRDNVVTPSSGQDHLLSVEYAGLGGDVGFTKFTAQAGWYIPIFKWLIGFIHGEAGYLIEDTSKILPDYERYYLGGIDSIRGFDWRGVHLYDEDGASVGGMQMLQANLELLFPIYEQAGLRGVIFFDTGQVFDPDSYYEYADTGLTDAYDNEIYQGVNPADFDISRLRKTAGFGFRWNTPGFGMIRIEYGYLLDKKDTDEDSGQWEFTMGTAF